MGIDSPVPSCLHGAIKDPQCYAVEPSVDEPCLTASADRDDAMKNNCW